MSLTPGTRLGVYEVLAAIGLVQQVARGLPALVRMARAPQIVVVQHWFEELKRLVPTN